jgi:hypothetical protein
MEEIIDKIKNKKNLCQCNAVSYLEVIERSGKELPKFENFLNENNLGNKCTSCLPDVEIFYNFVHKNLSQNLLNETIDIKKIKIKNQLNLKDKIYNLIDKMLPVKQLNYEAYIPVVSSKKMQTFIVNGNFSYPFNHSLTKEKIIYGEVYDSNGEIFWTFDEKLKPNKMLRLNIPKFYNEKISLGYAKIYSKFLEKGDQGTRRIHINLISDKSISQIHASAAHKIKELYVDYLCNNNTHEKIFLFISNIHKKKNNIKIYNNKNDVIDNIILGPNQSQFVQLPKVISNPDEKTSNIHTVRIESSAHTGLINIFHSLDENSIISIDHIETLQYSLRNYKLNKNLN